ncbi:hypothetical protein SAMN05880593_1492 [Rhizobium sp. RU36D]|nr:hypothetical protein SAMN05880593_1492 [Rhizobium sp. RU36D]
MKAPVSDALSTVANRIFYLPLEFFTVSISCLI